MAATRDGMNIGSYRIIGQIGQGGMATVYKAFQPSMQRHVALKVLPQHYASDKRFVERFIREARTIARLEHKNILPVYDFGEDNGITYIAMRYLDTGTLKGVLAEGRPTLGDIADIMTQVCSALDYAHRQGVIHRDVKPANILIDAEGSAYLTDFGIAKVLQDAPGLTETGAMIGTPAYAAPEQILAKPVDARTDTYALGIVLYEMVTGRVPFDADTPMAIAMAHLHDPLPLPRKIDSSIPEQVQAVIIKALAKDPDDRYQTPNALAADFRQAILDAGVDQTPPILRALSSKAHRTIMESTRSMQKRPPPTLAPPIPLEKPKTRRPDWLITAVIGGSIVVITAVAVARIVAVTGRALATTTAHPPATIRATQIVVVPAQPPTLAPTPSDPTLYDNFENPAFDGKYNRSLWRQARPECKFAQQNGTLVVTPTLDWCGLLVVRPEVVSLADIGALETRVKFEDDQSGGFEEQGLHLITFAANGKYWDASCALRHEADGNLSSEFTVQTNFNRAQPENLLFENSPAQSGKWYTFRLVVDPSSLAVRCLVDGRLLGTMEHPSDVSEIVQMQFVRELYNSGGSITGYFDDFHIAPPSAAVDINN